MPRFRTSDNVLTILDQSSVVMVVAVPFAILLIARYIDLSVGSAIAVAGVVGARMMTSAPGTLGGILVVLASGWRRGFNGVLCTYLRFSPIVVTLGMLGTLRGLAFVLQDEAAHRMGSRTGSSTSVRAASSSSTSRSRSSSRWPCSRWARCSCTGPARGGHTQAMGANPAASFLGRNQG